MVTESFDELSSALNLNGKTHADWALSMAKQGLSVSVLYLGSEDYTLSQVKELYVKKGITIMKLPAELNQINFGSQDSEKVSWQVMHYLNSRPTQFSTVYFTASSGAAFFTLKAKHQGLFCPKTRFVVGLSQPGVAHRQKLASGQEDFLVTDVKILKLDHMERKSVEMAVSFVIYLSSYLQDLTC